MVDTTYTSDNYRRVPTTKTSGVLKLRFAPKTEGPIVNELKQHQMYVQVVLEGCSIEFGPLSLVDLTNCTGTYARGYQIHCDAHKVKQDLIYNDVDEAVREFLELKKRLS